VSEEQQGAEFGYITQEFEDELQAALFTFDAEVQAAAKSEREQGPSSYPLTEFYLMRVFPVVRDFKAWAVARTNFFGRFDDKGFAALRLRYEEARAAWLAMGQKTTAPSVESSDAHEGAAASSALSAVEGAVTKVIVAGAGLGALYLLLKAWGRRTPESGERA
jgi:hypothetical protein